MQRALLLTPIALSVIFWATYHYHKDRHLPEPPLNLLLCFGLGLLAAGISKLMYLGLEPLGLRRTAGRHHLRIVHWAGIRHRRKLSLSRLSDAPGVRGTRFCKPRRTHSVRVYLGTLDYAREAGKKVDRRATCS